MESKIGSRPCQDATILNVTFVPENPQIAQISADSGQDIFICRREVPGLIGRTQLS